MSISIELAVPADAAALAEIHIRSMEAAYTGIISDSVLKEKTSTRGEIWVNLITDENAAYYVIRKDGVPAGFVSLGETRDEDLTRDIYEVYAIYLHPSYFRMGIGSYVMGYAVEKARNLGKTAVVVWVLEKNADSINFYRKNGFSADGGVKQYNSEKTLNIIRMRRNL